MRILVVVNGFPPSALGGVEVYTADVAKLFRQKGHEILIISRESDSSKPDHQVIRETTNGLQVIRIVNDFKQTKNYVTTYANPLIDEIFEREVNRFSPHVIHFNHLIALSAGMPLIAKRHQIPHVIAIHDYWPICQRVQLIDGMGRLCPGPMMGGNCPQCVRGGNSFKRWVKTNIPDSLLNFTRRILGRSLPKGTREYHFEKDAFDQRYKYIKQAIISANRVIVPSEYVRNQYVMNGYPHAKIEVLPLGIDIPVKPPSVFTGKKITFGFIGSLLSIKGVHTLIEAFRSVSMENIKLDIHGRDDLYPMSYVQQLKELADGDPRIHFKGSFEPNQRNQIYSQIDILVIPSFAPETFSIVAREALVRGIPVIASMVGALPEIIIHDVNGYLFKPTDVKQLGYFINHLAKNPNVLNNFSVPGPIKITSMGEHIQLLENMY